LFTVEFGNVGTNDIRLGVHQTGEGYRSRADTIKYKPNQYPVAQGEGGRKGGDSLVSSSNPQIVIIEQLAPQPAPRNIHPHTFKRSLDTRIRHLLRSVGGGIRMRHASPNRPKSPAGSTADREGVGRGRGLLRGVARRNFDIDGSPVIRFDGSFWVRVGWDVWSGGWDTSTDREGVLEVPSRIRGTVELPELFLVSGDLGRVRFDLFLELFAFVGEKSGLSGSSGLVEFCDVALVDFAEVGCQLITSIVHFLELVVEALPVKKKIPLEKKVDEGETRENILVWFGSRVLLPGNG